MSKDLKKRLTTIKKKLPRYFWAVVTYRDGTKKRLSALDALDLCVNGDDPSTVIDMSFIGDTAKEGLMSVIAQYFLAKKFEEES